jgi:hypothetical protein
MNDSAPTACARRSGPAAASAHDVSRHVLWPDYPLSRTRTEVNVATSALDRCVGTYQVPKGPAFGITRGNGRLTLTFPVFGPLVLRAENDHDFFLPELDCEIRFAAGGPIRELVMRPGRGWPSFPIPRVGLPRAPGQD